MTGRPSTSVSWFLRYMCKNCMSAGTASVVPLIIVVIVAMFLALTTRKQEARGSQRLAGEEVEGGRHIGDIDVLPARAFPPSLVLYE